MGFISSGTYGRVYKARLKPPTATFDPTRPTRPGDLQGREGELYAIKKFKPDKEGEVVTYTGISQSAIREIAVSLCRSRRERREGARVRADRLLVRFDFNFDLGSQINRELHHINVVALREVILEEKSIFMVFGYAEHDFLVRPSPSSLLARPSRSSLSPPPSLTFSLPLPQQIIHHHSQTLRSPIPASTLKSLLHQLINGVLYLHTHHILHRDLKPANILVTSSGVVKIGDLGLARVSRDPLQPLWQGDKVVVTIWYRSPELLLGGRHYTGAVGE